MEPKLWPEPPLWHHKITKSIGVNRSRHELKVFAAVGRLKSIVCKIARRESEDSDSGFVITLEKPFGHHAHIASHGSGQGEIEAACSYTSVALNDRLQIRTVVVCNQLNILLPIVRLLKPWALHHHRGSQK